MNVQIKSLIVQECGPLHDVEISFTDADGRPRPVTVIGGANGSGKTTILELIFASMQILHPDSSNAMYNLPIWHRTKGATIHLLIENEDVRINFIPDEGEPLFSLDVSSALESLQQQIRRGVLVSFLPFEWYQPLKQTDLLPAARIAARKTEELAPSVLYFPYYRRIVPVRGADLSREDVIYQWTYRYEAVQSFKGSLDAYLVWLEYAQTHVFEAIKRFINEIVLVDKDIAYVDRPKLQTMVKLKDGVTHPLDELSSGEQNLLIIMLELWRRLLPGSIVLIDEIENSLHPAFQHRLAEALLKLQARIPFQLIVTTHAPAFLDAFGTDSALILTEF
jgi:predicted ATPase